LLENLKTTLTFHLIAFEKNKSLIFSLFQAANTNLRLQKQSLKHAGIEKAKGY